MIPKLLENSISENIQCLETSIDQRSLYRCYTFQMLLHNKHCFQTVNYHILITYQLIVSNDFISSYTQKEYPFQYVTTKKSFQISLDNHIDNSSTHCHKLFYGQYLPVCSQTIFLRIL